MGTKSRNTVVVVAVALYAASLTLPTAAPFNPQFSDTHFRGWEAFQGGWRALGAFEPSEPDWWVLVGAWLANPLAWVAAVGTLAGRRRLAGCAGGAAAVLCLPALVRFGNIIVGQPGYWCWLASIALLAAGVAGAMQHPVANRAALCDRSNAG